MESQQQHADDDDIKYFFSLSSFLSYFFVASWWGGSGLEREMEIESFYYFHSSFLSRSRSNLGQGFILTVVSSSIYNRGLRK